MPTIKFAPNVDASRVTPYSREVLERILRRAVLDSCLVTRVTATPEEQARVMYDNLQRVGVVGQRRLYLAPGQRVIDTYAALVGRPRAECIAAMAATVREVGPARVSHHCADPSILNVIDIAPSSILDRSTFRTSVALELRPGGGVSRFLQPPTDPAFHVEIPQPQ